MLTLANTIISSTFYGVVVWHVALSFFLALLGTRYYMAIHRWLRENPPPLTEWGVRGRRSGALFWALLFIVACACLVQGSSPAKFYISFYFIFVAFKPAREFAYGFARNVSGGIQDPKNEKFKKPMRIVLTVAFFLLYAPPVILVWLIKA